MPPSQPATLTRQAPQLVMRRSSLADLPALAVRAGYTVRHFQPGDASAWEGVVRASFETDIPDGGFDVRMRRDPAFRPERIWFVCRDGVPVATASAWRQPQRQPADTGTLHMVGVLPGEAGKGLGLHVSLAALHQMHREGRTAAVLQTDDDRLPAIKTYLKLGFEPMLVDDNQRDRWPQVFEHLGQPGLTQQFEASLSGPVQVRPAPRENMDSLDRYQPQKQWLPEREHRTRRTFADFAGDESLYRPSQLGHARVSPQRAVVGAALSEPFHLTYIAGPAGLPEGGSVRFAMAGQTPLGFSWQHSDPTAPHYCQVSGPAHVTLTSLPERAQLDRGALREGDRIDLVVEDSAGLQWTPVAGRREFKVLLSTGEGEPLRRLPEPVVVDIVADQLERLEATLSCTRRPGEAAPLRVQVTARDRFDNRVPLNAPVEITLAGQRQTVPVVDGLAKATFADLADDQPLRAEVSMPEAKQACTSNVNVPDQELGLFIGDLHVHDFLSEAEGWPDDVYRWAIEDRGLDFLSLSAQSHGWHDNETWTIHKYLNERFLDEGRFVPLLGMEWQQSGYGDKIVHYLGGDQPYLPVDLPQYDHPAKLYEALRPSDALVISHHVGYPYERWVAGTDFGVMETDVERLVELWSMQGSSEGHDPADRPLREVDENNLVYAALRRGVRLGFVAGSDSHSARPGGSAKEPLGYWGGLAAVWAPALTRRDLFDALYRRHTYALTGARIVLKMTVNGALMGSELPAAEEADIRIDAWTPGTIAKIEILKNTRVLHTATPGGDHASLQFDDRTGGPAFYHCRVTQTDGQLAVASPVWIG